MIGKDLISYVESVARIILRDVEIGETFIRKELDLMYNIECPYYNADMKNVKTIISLFLEKLIRKRSIERLDCAWGITDRAYRKIGTIRKQPDSVPNNLAGGSPPKEKTRDYVVRLVGNIIGEMKLMSTFDVKRLIHLFEERDPYYTRTQVDHHIRTGVRLFDRLGYIRSIAGTGFAGNTKKYIVLKKIPNIPDDAVWDLEPEEEQNDADVHAEM